jgi:uncharacterized protein
MSSESLHAPRERLSRATLNHHQAIVSLMEELDAVDWYRQRAEDTEDAALREVLLHNMREEIEHACMILEWLRRNDGEWSKEMDTYLYTEAPITEVEEAEEASGRDREVAHSSTGAYASGPAMVRRGPTGKFTVGSLRKDGD